MIIKFLCRSFIKITGLIPFYFVTKQKKFYSSAKAKEESKNKKKEGKIFIANHTAVLDYCSFLYAYFFRSVKTFASELMYKNIPMRMLNWTLDNIQINRKDVNLNSLAKAEQKLKKNKTLLIFPEGHVEKEKGKIEKFYESAIVLSFRTNTPIIPHYVTGDYSLRKRNRIIVGEKIYIRDLIKKDTLEKEDIDYCLMYVRNKVLKLQTCLESIKKHRIKTLFTTKYWMIDLAKATTVPLLPILWPTKIYYLGNKKEIRRNLKYSCLLTGNHKGVCDVFFFYLFFKRRTRIIASDAVYKKQFVSFCMRNSHVIRFNFNNKHFDYVGFKEALNTLEGTGVVTMFPEGHISLTDDMLPINEGLAMLSLMTNSPIIPVYFINIYRYLRFNKVIMGDVIYPPKLNSINKEAIIEYNNTIIKAFDKMKAKANEIKAYEQRKDTRNIN